MVVRLIDPIARSLAERARRIRRRGETVPVNLVEEGAGESAGEVGRPKPKPKPKPGPPDNIFWWLLKLFFGLIWAILLTGPLVAIAILMWIPWTWFSFCRPTLYNIKGEKMVKAQYIAGDDYTREIESREVWASPGKGIEKRWQVNGFWANLGPFVKGRSWEMYELMRECWRTVDRQGLQVGGVLSGLCVLLFQVEIMAYDYQNPTILKFYDATYGGGESGKAKDILTGGDSMCGYVAGTAIATWAGTMENLVWYGVYHGALCLLCCMLMVDEILNVRVGCLAPQWSRAGSGYTIMFLAAATVSTSPNWGWKAAIRFRYVILICILLFGVYNVLRVFIVSFNLTEHTYANLSYRHRRHSLRPWKEPEWAWAKKLQDFRERDRKTNEKDKNKDKKDKYEVDENGDLQKIEKKDDTNGRDDPLPPKYLTERLQLKIGDHFRQWQKIDRKEWNYGKSGKRAQKVYLKTPEEHELERGQAARKVIHGFPLTRWPELTAQDREDMRRRSDYKFGAFYYGLPNWDPFAQWKRVPRNDADARKMKRERDRYTFHRVMLWIFDIRRVHSVCCAIGLLAVHIGLLIDAFANGHFASYRAEYSQASDNWKSNRGPVDSDCQYYSGSHIPIFVQKGTNSLKGVFAILVWLAIWHIFMLGMCAGVALVAFTNNRAMGMMLPVPITLIGPRLSSNGIGWTLGFIAAATAQCSLFITYPPIVLFIVKIILYNSVANWAFHLGPNYHMGNNRCIHTFWFRLNHMIYDSIDLRYKFHEQVYDHATF